jgi:hypothetical protein
MRSLLLVVVVGLSLVAVPAAASVGTRPTVKVPDTSPFTVRGRHFQAGERVTVTVTTSNAHWIRHTRAGELGGFRVVIASVMLAPCEAWSVSAVGRAGSSARAHNPLFIDCYQP